MRSSKSTPQISTFKERRRIAADPGGPCVAQLHRRGPGSTDPGHTDHFRRRRPAGVRRARPMAALLADRPARRHQGVRQSQRRVHGQHRADRQQRPVFGVVHVPVQDKTYIGCEGRGAELREAGESKPISVGSSSSQPVRIVGSRSHRGTSLDAFLEQAGRTRHGRHGQLAEILRRRRRQCGHLSATWSDLRVGHGGCAGRRRTGRWQGPRARRQASVLQQERGHPEPLVCGHRSRRSRLAGAVGDGE